MAVHDTMQMKKSIFWPDVILASEVVTQSKEVILIVELLQSDDYLVEWIPS